MAQSDSDNSMAARKLAAAPVRRRTSIADGLQLPSTAMHDTTSGDDMTDFGSRKRRHKVHETDTEQRPYAEVDEGSYSSKRRRSANWPLTDEQPLSPDSSQRSRRSKGSHSRRQVSSPGRLSRFQEASMHDRASDQPPSLFTRFFPSRGIAPIDQLMEDYHAANETAPDYYRASSRGPPHYPNQSVTSATSAATSTTANTRESGIFRFGRSLASSFNPVNIWQKMQQKWSEARQELIEEALDEQARQLRERALKADEVYAHLKKTGQLGTQGTHGIPKGTTIFAPGYTAPTDEHANQRDSGIAGIEPNYSRPYEQKDAAKSAVNISSPPERKSALHFRTPSFANLKKARSEAQLAKRAPPSSPTADLSDVQHPRTLRKIQSKKDLQKQLKLHKRVSDLEAKLQDARRELYDCLGDPTPPVPALPAHLAASLSSNKPRVPTPLRKRHSRVGGTMPTLPSERLLFPDVDDREEMPVPSHTVDSQTDNDQEQASSAQERDPPTPTATNDIWIADVEPAGPKKSSATRSASMKKRKSGDQGDLTYKPGPDANDDSEWDEATQDPPKKRRGRPKKNPALEAKTTTKESEEKIQDPDQTADQKQPQSKNVELTETAIKVVEKEPAVHASIDEAIESMTEEDVTTAKVMLRDGSPSKPSALATPSHPAMRRGTRSASPGQRRRSEQPEDSIVSVVPNGKSVPPMPSVPENLKLQASKAAVTVQRRNASFEWPDDVF